MDRRKFIRNASLSVLALSLSKKMDAATGKMKKNKRKILVGAHVWPYAAKLTGK